MFKKIARLFWIIVGVVVAVVTLVSGTAIWTCCDEERCKSWARDVFGWKFKD